MNLAQQLRENAKTKEQIAQEEEQKNAQAYRKSVKAFANKITELLIKEVNEGNFTRERRNGTVVNKVNIKVADYELRVFGVHYDAQEDTYYDVIYPDGSKSKSAFALERKTLKKKRGHGLFVPEGKIIETFEARIPQRVLTFLNDIAAELGDQVQLRPGIRLIETRRNDQRVTYDHYAEQVTDTDKKSMLFLDVSAWF